MHPRRWSLARQLLALQGLLLCALVLLGVAAVFAETQRDTEDRARDRVLALAGSLAVSPQLVAAGQTRETQAIADLQPYAEAVRSRTGVGCSRAICWASPLWAAVSNWGETARLPARSSTCSFARSSVSR